MRISTLRKVIKETIAKGWFAQPYDQRKGPTTFEPYEFAPTRRNDHPSDDDYEGKEDEEDDEAFSDDEIDFDPEIEYCPECDMDHQEEFDKAREEHIRMYLNSRGRRR